ncbi:hypothetical protein OKW38_007568 [Paraburkholderia sp. MM5496-R1]|uniref:hypothetical protein n=1 Tax=Paraburkholderia TaxID=1822464 RepID=UPI00115FA04D|nr:hypothetical protein [Paraburkholderia tuberum]
MVRNRAGWKCRRLSISDAPTWIVGTPQYVTICINQMRFQHCDESGDQRAHPEDSIVEPKPPNMLQRSSVQDAEESGRRIQRQIGINEKKAQP